MGHRRRLKKSTEESVQLHDEEMPLHQFVFLFVTASQETLGGSQKHFRSGGSCARQQRAVPARAIWELEVGSLQRGPS
eukprot:CAMPEP_0113922332 /NCGR_PEP_ID=MMETSP1159-20121227/1552_1 /TAXON_ID=88271 /ORGANISM="Picocystis salinarum" /LENGTH=77 /DNA_ID=CAMNT_0000922425 /DNA_START=370 /DNA_END=603 /DNA_ORIENTATION=+ /assembly_acc=CAM_ASM_000767